MDLAPAGKVIAVSLLLAGVFRCGTGCAEDQPGRGLQIMEKKHEPPIIEQQVKKPVQEAPGGRRILVKKFRFQGNTLLGDGELASLVAPAEGKELTLEQIKGAADLVSAKYHDRGYLIANAYIPAQSISDGTVLIQVVEGKVADIVVTGNKSYSGSFVKRHLERVRKDPSLDEEALERQLLLLNEYPSLTVRASLKPGREPGSTDIIAGVSDSFPISGSLSYDNFGIRSTSKSRLSAALDVGNLITSGDLLMLRGIIGLDKIDIDKLAYGRAEYMIPVGGSGTQLGAYYTNTVYAAGETLAPLEISGKADIAGFYGSYPIVKKRDESLSGRLGFEYASINDDLLGSRNHDDEIRKLALTFSYDSTDRFLGRNFFSVSYARGLGGFAGGGAGTSWVPDPKGEPQRISLASRQGADDSFQKLTVDAMRIQKLPGYAQLILRGGGQYSPDRLFLAEQFILGGEGTIRGFSPAKAGGDSGLFGSIELAASPFFPERTIFRQRVGDTIKLAVFADYGAVFITDAEPGEKETDHLFSVGAGARLYLGRHFSAKLDWAVPDRSGSFSTKRSQTWLQAGVAF